MSQDPREKIGFELIRAARLWITKLDERFAPLGLTQARWSILLTLSKVGGVIPQKDLAEIIGVEGPTVVRVLDGMERLGLIERRGHDTDRRLKIVHLTPQAERLQEGILCIAAELLEDILSGISGEDIAVCERVISTMLSNMGFSNRLGLNP
jgi:MarR family transcriptional regulator for hemolysin